eukprot:TRINITY_DN7485_c0_g2_i1.p1 TRINITY_DN7485_c0_g2~~TRINITY_DN7485_c0_g2_i1.p1  ORF type:complete len:348 (+),score=82.04 TRINITY_DN7485_c0_g2_i1:154-1197(+)
MASQIFKPYRAMGYICDNVPVQLQYHGTETFLITSIGKSYHMYNTKKLNLLFVGEQQPRNIKAIAIRKNLVFCSCGPDINIYSRGDKVDELKGQHRKSIISLLVFGDHLLSISKDREMVVWSIKEKKAITKIQFKEDFTPTVIMHPSTYLNKILIGSEEGQLQLWNIKSKKKIYEFEGWNSKVTTIQQSPALDVVGIGLQDGRIIIHNLKFDETITTFTHINGGEITCLAFRTDQKIPMIASASTKGEVIFWDLDKKELVSIMKNVHRSVTSLQFLKNQPVMLTSGNDNSVKMWIFDISQSEPRLLRFRSGHSKPPTKVRFYENNMKILSISEDRSFRCFYTFNDKR